MSNISPNRESISTQSPLAPTPDTADTNLVILSDSQQHALEWLIGGGSISEAAQVAGVTRQTISRWLRTDPDFRAVYDTWKLESNDLLEGRLIAAGDVAMDNLIDAVRGHGDVRVSEFIVKALLARNKPARG